MSSTFAALLAERQTDPFGRIWIYVPYDQLTDRAGPLAELDPNDLGMVLAESVAKGPAVRTTSKGSR